MSQEFAFNSVLSLYRTSKEIDPTFTNGKDVQIHFIKGKSYQPSQVVGYISGLDLLPGTIESDCIEPDCIEGNGIWTTAVKTSYSKLIGGIPHYWVGGSLDKEGTAWYVDVGLLCPNGEFDFIERYRPIDMDGRFQSIGILDIGTKVISLNKVSSNSLINLGFTLGDFLNTDTLIKSHISFKTCFLSTNDGYVLSDSTGAMLVTADCSDYYELKLDAEQQVVDLETISLGLIPLLLTNYTHNYSQSIRHYMRGEHDLDLTEIVNSAYSRLSRLLDLSSTSDRYGSIPKTLTTYIEPDQIYSEESDRRYRDPNIRLLEVSCIAEECIDNEAINQSLISREVSTRAVAWTLYSFIVYSQAWKLNQYDSTLEFLANYLINQLNKDFLPSKGWTHNITLSESTLIEEYEATTAVATCLALFKYYQYTNNTKYLSYGIRIYNAFLEYFHIDNKILFSLTDSNQTRESFTYGLLLFTLLKQEVYQEQLLNNYNYYKEWGLDKEVYLKDPQGNYIPDVEGGYQWELINTLTQDNLQINPREFSFDNLVQKETELFQVSNTNIILKNLLNQALDEGLLFKEQSNLERIFSKLADITSTIRLPNSLISLGELLSPNFVDNSYFSELPIEELDSYNFYKTLVLKRLVDYIPVDFGWFSKSALDLGLINKLLKSLTHTLTLWYLSFRNLRRNTFINKSDITSLDKLGKDYNYPRLKKEDIDYYKSTLSSLNQNSKAEQLGIQVIREDTYPSVAKFNTFNKQGFKWGEDYFIGNKYAPGTSIIKTNKPITANIYNNIIQKELGVSYYLEQSLILDYVNNRAYVKCIVLNTLLEACYLVTNNLEKIQVTPDNSVLIFVKTILINEVSSGNYIIVGADGGGDLVLPGDTTRTYEEECAGVSTQYQKLFKAEEIDLTQFETTPIRQDAFNNLEINCWFQDQAVIRITTYNTDGTSNDSITTITKSAFESIFKTYIGGVDPISGETIPVEEIRIYEYQFLGEGAPVYTLKYTASSQIGAYPPEIVIACGITPPAEDPDGYAVGGGIIGGSYNSGSGSSTGGVGGGIGGGGGLSSWGNNTYIILPDGTIYDIRYCEVRSEITYRTEYLLTDNTETLIIADDDTSIDTKNVGEPEESVTIIETSNVFELLATNTYEPFHPYTPINTWKIYRHYFAGERAGNFELIAELSKLYTVDQLTTITCQYQQSGEPI